MTAQSKMSPVATSMFSWDGIKTALWGTDVEEVNPNLYQYVRNWVKNGVPKPRNDEEALQFKWLLYFVAGAGAWYAASPKTATKFFNPWDMTLPTWLFWFSAKQLSLESYNDLVLYVLRQGGFKKLPTNPIPGVPEDGLELEPIDFFYLRVNAVIDMVFLSVNTYLMAHEGTVFAAPEGWVDGLAVMCLYQAVRVAASSVAVLLVVDAGYALLHWAMHKYRTLYNAIHRHHHRIVRPQGGLVDVRNYHPLEIVMSSSVILAGLYAVKYTVGVTWVSALIPFAVQVAANVADHSGYDVRFLSFHSGSHEMHHRIPTCNMGICTYFVDKYILGTYRPYTP